VHVDQRIRRLDQFGEDVVGELVGKRPVRIAREAAVQVLAVGRRDERRPRPECGQVHDRHRHHRSRELRRLEAAHHPDHGRDRGVLAAVDSAQDAQPRAVPGTGHLEARPLQVA